MIADSMEAVDGYSAFSKVCTGSASLEDKYKEIRPSSENKEDPKSSVVCSS